MENKELEKKKQENNLQEEKKQENPQEEKKQENDIPVELNEDSLEDVAGGLFKPIIL